MQSGRESLGIVKGPVRRIDDGIELKREVIGVDIRAELTIAPGILDHLHDARANLPCLCECWRG